MPQSPLGSKIEAFYLLKIRGGTGKMSESFFKFSLRPNVLHIFGGGGLLMGLENYAKTLI